MASKTKLLVVPCSGGETSVLAQNIVKILRTDFNLENQVELLSSIRREEVEKGTVKGHRHPLVIDYFPDQEVQVDIGRNDLKDVIQGKHVALVEHHLTVNREVTVNDHCMAVRGVLNVINNVETAKRTLVAPYLTYIRSHSIEKYKTQGFYQFDSLRLTLEDYHRGGLNAILTSDPHSEKAAQIAEEMEMDFHSINPFQSGRAINPYKLGLSGKKAKKLVAQLRPFQERFFKLKKENRDHLYVVSVDDGTEKRAENFVERAFPELPVEEVYAKLVYMDKSRISYDNSTTKFKEFSQIKAHNIDHEGNFIIIDDMYASGGTSTQVGGILKEGGAKWVEVWTSHPVTMIPQYEKANRRDSIDKVVCLDTVPQKPELNIETIAASQHLLAAELYKAHQRLITQR